jgi:nicotinamide-nucleotide amidase
MFAEIIATGDEIKSGAIVDSNSGHIAKELEVIGLEVRRHHTVGDDSELLSAIFREIGQRADFAIVTGGLGPTIDDLSAQAAADAAGVNLVMDTMALEVVGRYFKRFNRKMSPSNRKQALLPEGSEALDNPVGTAPGFMLSIDSCIFFFLPGVPYEMKRMLTQEVLPKLKNLIGENYSYPLMKTISCIGLPESLVGEKTADVVKLFPELKLGLRAKFPEIQVNLYGHGDDRKDISSQLDSAAKWIKMQLGQHAFSEDGHSMAAVVGGMLRSKKETIAVAESCTGGLIAHRLTNEPGSSDYFLLSTVTYANDTKINVLGVCSEIITRFGAVSKETAAAMAKGVRNLAKSTYGLAVSGIAGPGGGTPEKPVGTLCSALNGPMGTKSYKHSFTFGRRRMLKSVFAMTALDLLRKQLENQ